MASRKPPTKKDTMSNFVKLFEKSIKVSEADKNHFDRYNPNGTMGSRMSDYSVVSQRNTDGTISKPIS
jgi:hypothetical protein